MNQPTSIEAYHNGEASRHFSVRRKDIYELLAEMPHSTSNEVFEHLKRVKGLSFRYDSNSKARFTELRDQGLICNTGVRNCHITGNKALIWARVDTPGVVAIHRTRPLREKLVRTFDALIAEYGTIALWKGQVVTTGAEMADLVLRVAADHKTRL